DDALAFRPGCARQYDVRQQGRLRQEEVEDHVQVQSGEDAPGARLVGPGDDRVGAQVENAADLAGLHQLQLLEDRHARRRNLGRVDAPDRGDVLDRSGVGEETLARQLVAFLPVFATA